MILVPKPEPPIDEEKVFELFRQIAACTPAEWERLGELMKKLGKVLTAAENQSR